MWTKVGRRPRKVGEYDLEDCGKHRFGKAKAKTHLDVERAWDDVTNEDVHQCCLPIANAVHKGTVPRPKCE